MKREVVKNEYLFPVVQCIEDFIVEITSNERVFDREDYEFRLEHNEIKVPMKHKWSLQVEYMDIDLREEV